MRLPFLLLSLAAIAGAQAQTPPIELTLKRAVEIATAPEGSAQIQLSGEALRQAGLRSVEARAALLPNLSAGFTDRSVTSNLAGMGLSSIFSSPLLSMAGISIPSVVGYTNLDARVSASQTVFDFSSIRRLQAARVAVKTARSESENSSELVAAQVARAYLLAQKAEEDLAASQANVDLSNAVLAQAQNQKNAGTGTGIEITRARVQLANDRQRLLVAQSARRTALLQLLRAMGLKLTTEVKLSDPLAYTPADTATLEQARTLAFSTRSDFSAQQQRQENARLSASATKFERLPSVSAFGDWGDNGTGFGSSLPTRTYGISLKLPIFDGGRLDARRAESVSAYRSEKIKTTDLKEQIDLSVRVALDSLASAEAQVQVAVEGLTLAENELAQARRRNDAGIANALEVTDAQTRLERARDNRTQALYNYNVARLDLAQATGTVRRTIQ